MLGLLTFTCSVVCLLPQAYSNKLRLAALEVPGFIFLWCLGAQRKGMVINMKLPKSMSKYADRIEQIWSEGEDGYWVDYKPGWCSGALGTPDLGHSPAQCVHTEHEWSKRELWEAVSASEPCDCEECKNRKREEKR